MSRKAEPAIVVLGCNGLIGAAVSAHLRESGHFVIGADISDTPRDFEAKPHTTPNRYVSLNVADDEQVEGFFSSLRSDSSDVSVVINATYPTTAGFSDFPDNPANVRDFVALHLGSAINIGNTVCEMFRYSNQRGSLVNFSSIYASFPPRFEIYEGTNMSNPIAYAASKAGVESATRFLAKKYRPHGIRVNAVAPGGIRNGQDARLVEAYEAHAGVVGMLEPSDLLGVIELLVSPTSAAISGQIIRVDDGWTL